MNHAAAPVEAGDPGDPGDPEMGSGAAVTVERLCITRSHAHI